MTNGPVNYCLNCNMFVISSCKELNDSPSTLCSKCIVSRGHGPLSKFMFTSLKIYELCSSSTFQCAYDTVESQYKYCKLHNNHLWCQSFIEPKFISYNYNSKLHLNKQCLLHGHFSSDIYEKCSSMNWGHSGQSITHCYCYRNKYIFDRINVVCLFQSQPKKSKISSLTINGAFEQPGATSNKTAPTCMFNANSENIISSENSSVPPFNCKDLENANKYGYRSVSKTIFKPLHPSHSSIDTGATYVRIKNKTTDTPNNSSLSNRFLKDHSNKYGCKLTTKPIFKPLHPSHSPMIGDVKPLPHKHVKGHSNRYDCELAKPRFKSLHRNHSHIAGNSSFSNMPLKDHTNRYDCELTKPIFKPLHPSYSSIVSGTSRLPRSSVPTSNANYVNKSHPLPSILKSWKNQSNCEVPCTKNSFNTAKQNKRAYKFTGYRYSTKKEQYKHTGSTSSRSTGTIVTESVSLPLLNRFNVLSTEDSQDDSNVGGSTRPYPSVMMRLNCGATCQPPTSKTRTHNQTADKDYQSQKTPRRKKKDNSISNSMQIGVANMRSVRQKADILNTYIHENDLDLFFVIESWLYDGDKNDQRIIGDLKAGGYSYKFL